MKMNKRKYIKPRDTIAGQLTTSVSRPAYRQGRQDTILHFLGIMKVHSIEIFGVLYILIFEHSTLDLL